MKGGFVTGGRPIFRSIKQVHLAPRTLKHYEYNGLNDLEHLDRQASNESICETLLPGPRISNIMWIQIENEYF